MTQKMLYLLIVSALISSSIALYSSESKVIELNSSNFNSLVVRSKSLWMVEFFAAWCGHCKALAPEYSKAAEALEGIVKVGAVDASKHTTMRAQYDVDGYPTIKIFGHNTPIEIEGKQTAKALVKAALRVAKDKAIMKLDQEIVKDSQVVSLTDSNFDDQVMKSEEPWLVQFFDISRIYLKSDWDKIAAELKGKVQVGALEIARNHMTASKYGLQKSSSIKYFAPGRKNAQSVLNYDGKKNLKDIVAWTLEKSQSTKPATIYEISTEDVFKNNCDHICVILFLPKICNDECHTQKENFLKIVPKKYDSWKWLWTTAGSQKDLEKTLTLTEFPALVVLNLKEMTFSKMKGVFSKDAATNFLQTLESDSFTSLPKIPKIFSKIVEKEEL